jgi:hypothetical protein
MSTTTSSSLGAWFRFLGATTSDQALGELVPLARRLDDAYDAINYVFKLLAAAPDNHMADTLEVGRSCVDEAVEILTSVIRRIRDDGPNAA